MLLTELVQMSLSKGEGTGASRETWGPAAFPLHGHGYASWAGTMTEAPSALGNPSPPWGN